MPCGDMQKMWQNNLGRMRSTRRPSHARRPQQQPMPRTSQRSRSGISTWILLASIQPTLTMEGAGVRPLRHAGVLSSKF